MVEETDKQARQTATIGTPPNLVAESDVTTETRAERSGRELRSGITAALNEIDGMGRQR